MKKRFAHVHQSFDLMKLVINFCTSAQGQFELGRSCFKTMTLQIVD